MRNSNWKQVLSRLPDYEFFGREEELRRLYSLATERSGLLQSSNRAEGEDSSREPSIDSLFGPLGQGRAGRPASALLLGPPRVGKTEILRQTFDRLFSESGDVVPILYTLKPHYLERRRFAQSFLSQFLAQFIAFRRSDPRLISTADEQLASISRVSRPEDYPWVRSLVDSFLRASDSDVLTTVRLALSAPTIAAANTDLIPFVMVDNFHQVGQPHERRAGGARHMTGEGSEVLDELLRMVAADDGRMDVGLQRHPVYLLSGLRRPSVELIPPEEEIFGRLEMIHLEALSEDSVERMIFSTAARRRVQISDSTVELMIQQVCGDLFYAGALLDAAASSRKSIKTFMQFERVYTDEVIGGRICHYLGALLRDVAPDMRSRRALLEALSLVTEAGAALPLDTVSELVSERAGDASRLLARLHDRELMDINYGFVSASRDSVLADFVRTKYRTEVAGTPTPVVGDQLLADKLKESYRLMMSRFNRAIESQLVEALSQFDSQSVPASLFHCESFEQSHRGMSRVQVRRALEQESDRLRLPQMVLVNEAGSGELKGATWRLFTALGFEAGIYSDANEILWAIAVINSRDAVKLETLDVIDQRLNAAGRGQIGSKAAKTVRWYISKEGFSAEASKRLIDRNAYASNYSQLDFLQDHLFKISGDDSEHPPASEFELVIPIEDEAELIAARTVEQIARGADFDQESINQIKTALIEACINAAEHSDSPDRRIYQRFSLSDDRLVITISNKGKSFVSTEDDSSELAPVGALLRSRGRGLQIIRTLMDDVRFQQIDGGTSLVMTKFLKSPSSRDV